MIAFTLGLVPFSVLFVVQRTFYALGDTRTPFRFTLFQVVVFTAGAFACLALPEGPPGRRHRARHHDRVHRPADRRLLAAAAAARHASTGGASLAASAASFAALVLPLAAGVGLLVLLGGTCEGGFAVSGILGAIVSMAVIGVAMAVALLRRPLAAALARAPRLRRTGARGAFGRG